jgi:putative tryptophan/tyrosine transport system substrate-binding protein
MKQRTLLLSACGLALATLSAPLSAFQPAGAAAEPISIGVLTIAQAAVLDDVVAEFESAVVDGMAPTEVTFDEQNANGDQSLVASIARDFAASDHDAFAVIGTPAVIAVAQQITDRPVFALAMGDPVGAGVAESLEEPGANVTGSIDYVDPALLVDQITKIHPELGSLGTVYDPSNQNMQVFVADLRDAVQGTDIELVEATIAGTADVAQASRSLLGRSDVILIGPDAAVFAGLDAVGAAAVAESVPLYAIGGDITTPGLLGSIGPDYYELGTTAGLAAVEVLLGADPGTVPFAVPDGVELQFNGATVEQLGLEVPAEVLEEATVTSETPG